MRGQGSKTIASLICLIGVAVGETAAADERGNAEGAASSRTTGASSDSASEAMQTSPPEATGESRGRSTLQVREEFTGRNAMGVMGGLSSGIGLSYRRYLTNRFALRGSGYLFYLAGTEERSGGTLYNVGVVGQIDFRRDAAFAIYAIGGVGITHSAFPGLPDFFSRDMGVFPGVGLGLELGPHDRPAFNYQIELMLTGMFIDGTFTRLLPLPQLGFHYIF